MILFTNGDSWTQGDSPAQTINWEATKSIDWYNIPENFGDPYNHAPRKIRYKFYDSPVWPKVLGELMGAQTYNAGRLGSDNYSILRRSIYSIEKLIEAGKKPDLAIIGWSAPSRVPFFKEDYERKLITLSQARPTMGGTKFLYEGTTTYGDMSIFCYYTLHKYLEQNGINVIYFNAFENLRDEYSPPYSSLLDPDIWMNRSYTENHFIDYILEKHNLRDWRQSEYFVTCHPTDISHIDWGKHMYQYIKNRKLI